MPSNAEVLRTVEDAVETEIQKVDVDQVLSYEGYDTILRTVADEVFEQMIDEDRPTLNAADLQYIEGRVSQMIEDTLARPTKVRFQKFERVVCRIGGEHGWAPGTIQALDEDDPQDPTGRTKLPYVVKLDAPIGRLISVPYDEATLCVAEVCFGQTGNDALPFTLRCKPQRPETRTPRFGVGDRVACAVEDEGGDYTVWAAGKISDIDYDITEALMRQDRELGLSWDWTKRSGVMPYRVLLDSGTSVYVHRDVHWLLRDLELQAPGPRQAAGGTRALKRLVKRRCGESGWETIDHATRRARYQAGGDSSDDDSDDEGVSIS